MLGLHRATLVDRPAEDVHDASERAGPDRHRDRRAGVRHVHAAAQPVGGAERDGAHHTVAQLLLDLEREALLRERLALLDERERIVDVGHRLARELDVDHRSDALDDLALLGLCRAHVSIPV